MKNTTPLQTKDKLILSLPLLIFILVMAVLEIVIYQNSGHVLYPIDDPYIHLAMARHWVEDGFMGVSEAGFSAASSSPGWTMLLGACFYLFGNQEWIPLVLNVVFSVITIVLLTRWFYESIRNVWLTVAWTFFTIAILPLPALTVVGMEHTAQILLTALLISRAVVVLGSDDIGKRDLWIFLLAVLATLIRYETAFVISPLCVLFLLRGRWKTALLLGLCAAAPIVLLGCLYIREGWYFFPSSIMLKTALLHTDWERFAQLFKRFYGQLLSTGYLLVPFTLGFFALFRALRDEERFPSKNVVWSFVFICATLQHCSLALLGWFHRYEAYLLLFGAVSISPLIPIAASKALEIWNAPVNLGKRILGRGVLLLAVLLGFILFYRQIDSIRSITPGARNLYCQQYQMGLFLKTYYSGETVFANDVGAINFLADIHCLDLSGLASIEPLRANRLGRWSPSFVESWGRQHNAKIAVIYESWWGDLIPQSWIKTGELIVEDKVTVADSVVSFFALSPSEEKILRQCLSEFSSKLPDGVVINLGPTP